MHVIYLIHIFNSNVLECDLVQRYFVPGSIFAKSWAKIKNHLKMGQQQLLLIVLGIMLIGIAIIVGINLFKSNAVEVKRNNIINDCINLATLAQQHYRKPGAIGGGSKSFDGSTGGASISWEIPSGLTKNANGWFKISSISKDELVIIGTGNEVVTGSDSVQVSVTITPHDYTTVVIH